MIPEDHTVRDFKDLEEYLEGMKADAEAHGLRILYGLILAPKSKILQFATVSIGSTESDSETECVVKQMLLDILNHVSADTFFGWLDECMIARDLMEGEQ